MVFYHEIHSKLISFHTRDDEVGCKNEIGRINIAMNK